MDSELGEVRKGGIISVFINQYGLEGKYESCGCSIEYFRDWQVWYPCTEHKPKDAVEE